ncbi:MAG: GtrA family protein [Anaerolineae bacterium]|nr:GtrA family protein [Anaerolineae bacterium]
MVEPDDQLCADGAGAGLQESLITRLVADVATRVGGQRPGRIRTLASWIVKNRREVDRFVRFGLVGTLGTVVDFSVLNALILGLHLTKFWANTCSFSVAALSNFIWNRLWTFPESRARPFGRQLAQFFAVSVGGYAINQALFLSLDRWVFAGWGTLGYNLAKAIAIVVVLFWNFGANRIWTYRGL